YTDRMPGAGPAIDITNGAQFNVIGNDTGSGDDHNVIGYSGDESEPGIVIEGPGTDNKKVVGNLIGTFPDGVSDASNDAGVLIKNGAKLNTVGGTGGSDPHLISAHRIGVPHTHSGTAP